VIRERFLCHFLGARGGGETTSIGGDRSHPYKKHLITAQKIEQLGVNGNHVIPSPHLLVMATNERFLPARGTFRTILASESHWLQLMLVLSVRWWPTPAGVGKVLVATLNSL
jgi:hypothetical protein